MATPYPNLVQKKTLQTAPTVGTGTYTISLDAPSTSGNLIVAVVSSRHNVGNPTIGVTGFTELYNIGHLGGTGDIYWQLYCGYVISTGQTDIDVTIADYGGGVSAAVYEYENIDQLDPFEAKTSGQTVGVGTNITTNIITSGEDPLMIGAFLMSRGSVYVGATTGNSMVLDLEDQFTGTDFGWQYMNNLQVYTSVGSGGTTLEGSAAFVSPTTYQLGGFLVAFNQGQGLPSIGSLRTDPFAGWSHIADFQTEPWASDGRILSWGNVRRKTSHSGRGFSNGIDALEMADTDLAIWGSTFGAGGTSMLWRNIQINSKWVNTLLGTQAGTVPLVLGRVVEFGVSENKVTLGLYDGIEEINNAQFVWDYDPLWAAGSSGEIYGTVYDVIGSTIIIEESPDHDLRKTLNTIQNLDVNRRSFSEKWARLGNLGVIGTDSLVSGDIIKFHSTSLFATDAGSVLLTAPQYTVQSGSFYVSQTSARKGTFGTIEFQSAPVGVSEGDFIFKQKPLWYRGNPANIVRDILTGSNTNLRWGTDTIQATYYGAATAACAQMNFESLITTEGQGGVIKALKDISDPVDAVFFFDRVGSFCWLPFRPRLRDDADFVSENYSGTMLGGSLGSGNMWGAEWETKSGDILTDVTFNFNYNHFEDESGVQYRGQIQRQNLTTSNRFRGFRNAGTFNTEWVKDYDDAVVLAERKLRAATVARAKYKFQTSLYGLETDLYQMLHLTHRTGSLNDSAWQVDEVDFDIDGDLIAIRLKDISDVYFGKGYGYFENGPVASHTVSGTSRSGWGWVHGSTGTTGGISLGSLGTLVVLWNEAGNNPAIGNGGYTQWITIGSEVMKVTSLAAAATKVVLRGADVSDAGTHTGTEIGWHALPQDTNGDLIALYNGTEFNGTHSGPAGTVHNISVGTWGTVWRLW